ncbi:MAG TPA: response regulator [Candidatus Cybelea sp.]|nr:response regulator [Candidatus Cybelea sp.]
MLNAETGLNGLSDAGTSAPDGFTERTNILLVDDREDKRMAMEAVIAELGQNIVKVSSGKEALRSVLQQDFAVILLDVNMPGMDGFETAFLIRQRRNSEHTPIIFITGVSDTETHVSRGYSLGAVDYITTPVLPEVLRTKVWVFVELFKKAERIKRQAERLRLAHDDLDERVKARTKELAAANKSLQQEVAERQAAEDEVRKLNADLEQRVIERTSALAASNSDLEAFTYSVAHDLQAPLRHIQSYAEMLEMDFSAQIPKDAQQYLKRIASQGKSMARMLEDLLRLSLIGKQDLSLQKTRLADVVEDALAGIRPEINGRNIEWRVGDLPQVSCDPGLIKLVFVNLLSNAVKYTRPRQEAVVEIGQTRRGDERPIYVRDNGVGFGMEHAGKLFGVFQRLHRASEFEGNGVGLATVARIVRKHGGRIWAEAEENKGASFFFTLEQKEGET